MANGIGLTPSGQTQAALAQMLLQQGAQNQNLRSPLQVLGNLAQTFVGSRMLQNAAQQQESRQKQLGQRILASTGTTGDFARRPQNTNPLVAALLSDPSTIEAGIEVAARQPERFTKNDVMTIQTPDGPRIVPISQALNQAPARDPSKSTSRERQIAELRARGFSLNDAQDIASGRVNVVTDEFGRRLLVNEATGEERFASMSGDRPTVEIGTPEVAEPETDGIPELERAALEGTGPGAAIRQAANNLFGFFKEGQIAPETAQARTDLRIFNQQIKQALTANPRNPVAELNTIQGFLPDTSTIFTDPDGERQKIQRLRGFLRREREINENAIENSLITPKERARLADKNSQIDRALQIMDQFGVEEPGGTEIPDNVTVEWLENNADEVRGQQGSRIFRVGDEWFEE